MQAKKKQKLKIYCFLWSKWYSFDDEANKDNTTEKVTEKEADNIQPPSTKDSNKNLKSLKAGQTTVDLKIPDYDQTAWANGDIKEVTATVNFGDNTSTGKK